MKIDINLRLMTLTELVQNFKSNIVSIKLARMPNLRKFLDVRGFSSYHLNRTRLKLLDIIFFWRQSEANSSWSWMKIMNNGLSNCLTIFHRFQLIFMCKMSILVLVLASPSSYNFHIFPDERWRNYVLLSFWMRKCFTILEPKVPRLSLIKYYWLLMFLW